MDAVHICLEHAQEILDGLQLDILVAQLAPIFAHLSIFPTNTLTQNPISFVQGLYE